MATCLQEVVALTESQTCHTHGHSPTVCYFTDLGGWRLDIRSAWFDEGLFACCRVRHRCLPTLLPISREPFNMSKKAPDFARRVQNRQSCDCNIPPTSTEKVPARINLDNYRIGYKSNSAPRRGGILPDCS